MRSVNFHDGSPRTLGVHGCESATRGAPCPLPAPGPHADLDVAGASRELRISASNPRIVNHTGPPATPPGSIGSNVYVIQARPSKITAVKFRGRDVHRLREFPQDVIRILAGSRRAVIHRLAPAAIELSTAEDVYAHSYPQAIHKVPGVVCRWPRQLVLALGIGQFA